MMTLTKLIISAALVALPCSVFSVLPHHSNLNPNGLSSIPEDEEWEPTGDHQTPPSPAPQKGSPPHDEGFSSTNTSPQSYKGESAGKTSYPLDQPLGPILEQIYEDEDSQSPLVTGLINALFKKQSFADLVHTFKTDKLEKLIHDSHIALIRRWDVQNINAFKRVLRALCNIAKNSTDNSLIHQLLDKNLTKCIVRINNAYMNSFHEEPDLQLKKNRHLLNMPHSK